MQPRIGGCSTFGRGEEMGGTLRKSGFFVAVASTVSEEPWCARDSYGYRYGYGHA